MIDETLTMIPGPTPVHPRILAALSRPTTSHVAPVTRTFGDARDLPVQVRHLSQVLDEAYRPVS